MAWTSTSGVGTAPSPELPRFRPEVGALCVVVSRYTLKVYKEENCLASRWFRSCTRRVGRRSRGPERTRRRLVSLRSVGACDPALCRRSAFDARHGSGAADSVEVPRYLKKIPADAFEHYFVLGPGRSYQQVAEKYSVTKRAVTPWRRGRTGRRGLPRSSSGGGRSSRRAMRYERSAWRAAKKRAHPQFFGASAINGCYEAVGKELWNFSR